MAQSTTQFKIFLSSPGDVQEERELVRELIKDSLPYSPFIRGRATFDVVSWDDPHAAPGLDAHLAPQEAINRKLSKPSECDIVIVILWGRMGTPLPPEITREDGSTYQSGTEWEFEDAVNAAKQEGRPTTLLYQRTEEPKIGLDDPELRKKVEQYQKVKAFFKHFRHTDGSLKCSIASYETIDAFREVLRQHLESVVNGFLGQEFSEELGVTKAAVETMLGILQEQQVPAEQLEAKLKEIAERHVELTEKLHALSKSNDEPEITKRREQAAEAIEQGDYDRADELLAEAVAIDRLAIDEQQDELDRRKLSAAATIGQQGELERTRLKYRKAAEHFAEAAEVVITSSQEKYYEYLNKQADVLYLLDREFGELSGSIDSINIYRQLIESMRDVISPKELARTYNNLGHVLEFVGWRKREKGPLEEAAQAHRFALDQLAQDSDLAEWARTQGLLGQALRTPYLCSPKIEFLEEAVRSHRTALEVCSAQDAPTAWAFNQAGLGHALVIRGQHETGSTRLEEAVTVIKSSLSVRRQDREPLQWAHSQGLLGGALSVLGARKSDKSVLDQAIGALHAALTKYTRDRAPMQWAMTQMSLGSTLERLGALDGNPKLLRAAVDAHRLALEELSVNRAPLQWAAANNSLAKAMRILGEVEKSDDLLDAAIKLHLLALGEYTKDEVILGWAWTQKNLGLAYVAKAENNKNKATLLQGIQALKSAIGVYEEMDIAHQLETTRRNLTDADNLLRSLKTSP